MISTFRNDLTASNQDILRLKVNFFRIWHNIFFESHFWFLKNFTPRIVWVRIQSNWPEYAPLHSTYRHEYSVMDTTFRRCKNPVLNGERELLCYSFANIILTQIFYWYSDDPMFSWYIWFVFSFLRCCFMLIFSIFQFEWTFVLAS